MFALYFKYFKIGVVMVKCTIQKKKSLVSKKKLVGK